MSRAPRHNWTQEEYTTLYLLYTQWTYSPQPGAQQNLSIKYIAVERLLGHMYPDIAARPHRADHFRATFNDRHHNGKSRTWKQIDRPNDVNKDKYETDEMTEFYRLKARIERAAEDLRIDLIDAGSPAPWNWCKDEDLERGVARLLTAVDTEGEQAAEQAGEEEAQRSGDGLQSVLGQNKSGS